MFVEIPHQLDFLKGSVAIPAKLIIPAVFEMKIEEIKHIKIQPGIHQWNDEDSDGMTAGSIEVLLPGGTVIQICSVEYLGTGRFKNTVSIHNLNDTEVTIFSKVKKSIRRVQNTIWTKIMGVEA